MRLAIGRFAILAVLVAACGSTTAPPAPPAAAPTQTSTSSASLASSPSPSPTPVPQAFVSPFYHYSLLLPAEAAADTWRPARGAWDGLAKMDSASNATDAVDTAGGLLFVFGQPTHADLETYRKKVIDTLRQWHPCSQLSERPTKVGGEPARLIGFLCAPFQLARIVLVHHGFGLVLNLDTELAPFPPIDTQMRLLESYVAPIKLLP